MFHFVLCYRQECKKLREELKEEHEEDKNSALAQLAQSKEQELSNARESWQRKVEDLLEQVRLFPMGAQTVPPILLFTLLSAHVKRMLVFMLCFGNFVSKYW